MRGLASLVVVALVAGCFSGEPLNGALKCNHGPGRICPSGYYCANNDTCWMLNSSPDGHDMAMSLPAADMAQARVDLASVDGGGAAIMDLTMAMPMDMSAQLPPGWSYAPAHISAASWIANAPSMTLNRAGANAIDTDARTINGATNNYFLADSGSDHSYAVLSVGGLTVQTPVTVTGKAALIIVSTGAVMLSAPIHADAVGSTPGPGASDASSPGAGGPGTKATPAGNHEQSGGGGGSFGTSGAIGGSGDSANTPAGAVKNNWVIGPKTAILYGGSPGGPGSATQSNGGGGGGAVQISSSSSITIANNGGISVNGGGGQMAIGGGGGGSGGQIFLEAPSLNVAGNLIANGGGGSGSGCLGCGGTAATNGSDGFYGSSVASGGLGQLPMGGGGGAGAAGVMGSFVAAVAGGNNNSFAGGGGGGAGFIWLRYPAASPPTVSGVSSPAYGSDATLP
jgi:hypothetical protein